MTNDDINHWLSTYWFSWDTLKQLEWSNTYYIYGIGLLPLLFLLRWLFHGRAQQKLQMAFIQEDIHTSWIAYLRFLQPLFLFIGLALILIALARPQQINEQIEKFSEGIEIVLALDISESMLSKDVLPSRLEAAKKVAEKFVMGRFQDRIGLVVFAGDAFTLCPLTTDYDVLNQYLKEVSPTFISKTGTALGNAIGVSINCLRDSQAKSKIIILLSDGDNTAGELDPILAAQLANAYGVRLYTISVGLSLSNPLTNQKDTLRSTPADVIVDEFLLQKLANTTNGNYFKATNAKTLENIFKQIDTLEKITIKTTKYREVRDVYHVYLRWAIVFLLSALLSKVTFITNILED
jgi:Ca-activated chloride channel homolog